MFVKCKHLFAFSEIFLTNKFIILLRDVHGLVTESSYWFVILMLYSREGHGAATVSRLLDSDTSSSKHPSNKDAARYVVSGGFPVRRPIWVLPDRGNRRGGKRYPVGYHL